MKASYSSFLFSVLLVSPIPSSPSQIPHILLHHSLLPQTSPDLPSPPSPPSIAPFFRTDQSPPPPPPPQLSSPTSGPPPHAAAETAAIGRSKKVAIVASVLMVTLGMLSALTFYLYKHRAKSNADSSKLPAAVLRRPTPSPPRRASNLLYIGTVGPTSGVINGCRSPLRKPPTHHSNRYRPSPELLPLPPLIKPPSPPSSDGGSSAVNGGGFHTPTSRHSYHSSMYSSPQSKRTVPPPPEFKSAPPPAPPPPPPPPPRPPPSTAAFSWEKGVKPRLKPLHWDKVGASSEKATVWDRLKSSSFQLNEDMMESLFGCESAVPVEEKGKKTSPEKVEKEKRILDPKKSHNIAILLRALNVTNEEVTHALTHGNPEALGSELLETLVKMRPTKEEEMKLKGYDGDVSKLGSAERFLKAILDVPHAFQRVEAMLYRADFDTEVNHLTKSYETLEAASEELKNSRLFLKLLEAVLKSGNRMNIGTNRGDALAFKLDTLLKLVDIKGTDGKTTLLHFVVQEIVRSEHGRVDPPDQNGRVVNTNPLRVVSGLSRELNNVKASAGMDSDALYTYVTKLETGLEKIRTVLRYATHGSDPFFFDSTRAFLENALTVITDVKARGAVALARVKEVTEYFHGNAAKEEAHPLRIFVVVRDFLSVLDAVCKEVGGTHERPVMGVGFGPSIVHEFTE